MRATYFLKQQYDNYTRNARVEGDERGAERPEDVSQIVIDALAKSLANCRHGSLLRHEFAYVMGQLRDERAASILEKTLMDEDDNAMVRHECAEALGAIGSTSSIAVLEKCGKSDGSVEVGETCRLALDYIRWKTNGGEEGEESAPIACACMLSPYSSIDPAPPHPRHAKMETEEIGAILLNESESLFERFRAMFSLRNRGGAECVKHLGNALVKDSSSALLRHEVAYVLGQLQHSDAVEYLELSLKRDHEHCMVRHESAEALGAIEERWGECETILSQFLHDDDDVVRESCLVALDAADYWGHSSCSRKEEDNMTFSLHKAEACGGEHVGTGALQNHFNCV